MSGAGASPGTKPGQPQVEQHWDPARYIRNASFVAKLGAGVAELLAAQQGERILDLGCGDGALTVELAKTATVLGVDASPEQIAAAKAQGLDAHVMDGTKLTFESEFDAVFSNAALHWMRDPDAVIAGVWRALKPGGRFVAECGGAGNVRLVLAALLAALDSRGIDARPVMPWYFATVEEYNKKLEKQGFEVRSSQLIPRPTPLPGRLADWLDTFGETFLALVPAGDRQAVKDEVEDRTRAELYKDGVWSVDYVRLRFAALKPAKGAS